MKYASANNSIRTFEGVVIFEGTINKYPIRLKNVYYSKQITMNLLSDVKLANDDLFYEIESIHNKNVVNIK